MKKVLIAIDNGPTSEKVAQEGLKLGQQLKAEIAIISVVDTELLMADGGVTTRELADITKIDFINKQKMLVDQIFKGQNIWTFVEEGKPYEMILKVADEWNADIIVLGTHGRTGLQHLLMGSLAEKVIRHSSKPLFIIPTK